MAPQPDASYPYVLVEQDSSVKPALPPAKENLVPEGNLSAWARLMRQVYDRGSMINALLPTFSGGISVIAILWALVTSGPVSLILGAIGLGLGALTIYLFVKSSD